MKQSILPLPQVSLKRGLYDHPTLDSDTEPRKLRIALYSHDTVGMGHMRRNLLISQALSHSNLQVSILMITGARQASAAQMPPGVDCITLPALSKESKDCDLSRSLDIPVHELTKIRSQVLQASVGGFDPAVLIVDNVPRGAQGELDATLRDIRRRGRPYCVLGLPDVLDEPERVKVEWRKTNSEATIRDSYDKIWIYGDPNVYDPVREYHMPSDIADKVSYTGYFDRRIRFEDNNKPAVQRSRAELGLPDGRFVLCMADGGHEGLTLTNAFARATLSSNMFGVIVTGPFMPAERVAELHHMAATRTNLKVFEFVNEPTFLLQQADYVIAMGGYNVVSEILSFEKRALIVPCVSPRREQLLRAERLKALGMVDLIHPENLTPEGLSVWLDNASRYPSTPSVHAQLDFGGLTRLPALISEVCQITP